MEGETKKQKKTSSMLKKLERCLSIVKKTGAGAEKSRVTPTGCVSVYVGPEKQRFVIKTEFVNHPLFKILLEDAELEYGFANNGPLLLPCDVDLFYKVLAEMDCGDEGNDGFDDRNYRPCGFSYGSCSPFSPARRFGKSHGLALQGCGSYRLQTPTRFVKMNQF